MTRWELSTTHELVEAQFGAKQMLMLKEYTRSLVDRQNYAAYHYHEALRLHRAFERKYMKDGMLLDIFTQQGRSKRRAFEVFIVKISAHSLAAVQSIHALPDILAHVVYFGTGRNLDAEPLQEHEVAVRTVVASLKKTPFRSLGQLLETSQSGVPWKQLAAIANQSKHRSVVRSSLNEDLTGTRAARREIQFQGFEHSSNYHPGSSIKVVLEPEFDRLAHLIVNLGNELTDRLRTLAA